MKKIGIVFPGQGSQYVGMGRKLYETYDFVKEYFDRADKVLGYSITDLCFNGPEDTLRQTFNTQPALVLIGYSVWQTLRKNMSISPFCMAGHSLGEYTALLASGFFSFEDAVSITHKRGLYMEEACPKGKGGMVALIGADMSVIGPLLEQISHDDYVAVPANLNSAEQVVLSGDIEALKEAVEKTKGSYKKAVFLNVSGPFHSPLMKQAAEKLKGELSALTVNGIEAPVVSNVDATPSQDSTTAADRLYRQMFSPVLWEKSVKRMAEDGVELFLEVGPQKVLTNLIKRIVPGIPCCNVESVEEIEAVKGLIE